MNARWQWTSFDGLRASELYSALRLRQEVFVVEQDCAYLDADGLDDRAHHLLQWRDGALIGYLRAFSPGVVYAEAAVGRVVTAPAVRGTGLGRPLMREGLQRVEQTWGPGPVKLSAQSHLRRFYESLGFEVCGEGYLEDGIPHLPMCRPCA